MMGICNGLHRSELVHFVDVLTVRWPFVPCWTLGGAGAYRSTGRSTNFPCVQLAFASPYPTNR